MSSVAGRDEGATAQRSAPARLSSGRHPCPGPATGIRQSRQRLQRRKHRQPKFTTIYDKSRYEKKFTLIYLFTDGLCPCCSDAFHARPGGFRGGFQNFFQPIQSGFTGFNANVLQPMIQGVMHMLHMDHHGHHGQQGTETPQVQTN